MKYTSLLTLLYAGTTSFCSLKYSIFNYIVKILSTRSKSAGNYLYKISSSETLRNEITICNETVKKISIHTPKHLKPINDDKIGHYLAGLIDGDGHFSSKQQLVIAFNYSDIKLAYYIKKKIGYGNVSKVKNKNAVLFIVANEKGLQKVINLINGKFRTYSKYDQLTNNIMNNKKFTEFNKTTSLNLNISNDLDNYWLAGFSDADASFQIKMLQRKHRTEIRLNYQIDQKKDYILLLIKGFLGGNIGYRKSQDTYYYGSTSFGSAKNIINYFDRYNMLSTKHVDYLKWRKAYVLIQDKSHLSEQGLNKIKKLKVTMNRLS